MRALLVATAVCATLVPVAAPAHAHPSYHYEGGCLLAATSAPSPDYGPATTWTGIVGVAAVATTSDGLPLPTTSISVECRVYINGVPEGVWSGAAGVGAAVAVAPRVFNIDPDDVLTVCEFVTVGNEEHVHCGDATTTPFVPDPGKDAARIVVDRANDAAFGPAGAWVCPVFANLGPGVPNVLELRGDGDVVVLDNVVYDCPPYESGGGVRALDTVGNWYVIAYLPRVW